MRRTSSSPRRMVEGGCGCPSVRAASFIRRGCGVPARSPWGRNPLPPGKGRQRVRSGWRPGRYVRVVRARRSVPRRCGDPAPNVASLYSTAPPGQSDATAHAPWRTPINLQVSLHFPEAPGGAPRRCAVGAPPLRQEDHANGAESRTEPGTEPGTEPVDRSRARMQCVTAPVRAPDGMYRRGGFPLTSEV